MSSEEILKKLIEIWAREHDQEVISISITKKEEKEDVPA